MMQSAVVAGFLVLASILQTPAPALRIVVIEGEGAVNIIQQKTAVRPLVEVRDRNNVPVAGATVTFAISGGQPAAFAGGLQTLTVTTNAAGQAAAGGLNALSSGAFQIQVQAAYQGQIATAAISQTNFATAAAAAQAGSAAGAGGTGGSTSGAAGGAAGGGGGISGTTLGIVGAAVAGGAVAATQIGGGGEEGSNTTTGGSQRTFTGVISGQFVMTTTTASSTTSVTCVSTRSINANITITLRDGNTNGQLQTTGTNQEISVTGSPQCSGLANPTVPFNIAGDVTGGPGNLTFQVETSASSTSPAEVTVIVTRKFTGSLSGDSITGTFGYAESSRGTNGPATIQGGGTSNFPVTLR
jgi:hypothetical protein